MKARSAPGSNPQGKLKLGCMDTVALFPCTSNFASAVDRSAVCYGVLVGATGGAIPTSSVSTQPVSAPPLSVRYSTSTHSRLNSSKRRSAGRKRTLEPLRILPMAVNFS